MKTLLLLSTALALNLHNVWGMDTKDDEVVQEISKNISKNISYKKGNFMYHKDGLEVFTEPHKPNLPLPHSNQIYKKTPQSLPMEQKVLMRINEKVDGRLQIKNTTEWPYRIHGQLTMTYGNKEYGGSGVLIGPHHVLTAAHNVYIYDQQKWADDISVYLGLDESSSPFKERKVVKVYTFPQWVKGKKKEYDMALLLLDSSIGNEIGWGGLLCSDDEGIKKEKIAITGYPGDHGFTKMMSMSHTVKTPYPEEFYYDIDTAGGQSGSGIWINQRRTPFIVGIHAYGEGKLFTGNSGVRLSPSKFEKIIGWISESLVLENEVKNPPLTLMQKPIKIIKNSQKINPFLNQPGELLFNQHFPPSTQKSLSKEMLEKIKTAYKQKLTTLNLSGPGKYSLKKYDISDEVVKSLSKNPFLTSLNLSGNNIGADGAEYLSENTILTTLDISSNNVGPGGAECFSQNITLTWLNLASNEIGDIGAESLLKNTTLTSLDITGNKIHDFRADSLSKNTTLTSLNLSYSKIGEVGIESLLKNTTITELNYTYECISSERARNLIWQMLERNRKNKKRKQK